MDSAGADLSASGIGLDLDGRPILRDVSIRAAPGEFVGLIGPNGSGKSSLLKCLYRLHRPKDGRVHLDGLDIWPMGARACARQMAVLAQENPPSFGLRVRDVVALGRLPHDSWLGYGNAGEAETVLPVLERLDLAPMADRPFEHLSGGEQQRVLLARAIVQRPRVMILDEPTNHLDIRHQWELLQLVADLGITVVAAVHDLNVAAAFCDRIYVMQQGRLCAEGAPAEVLCPAVIRDAFGMDVLVDTHPVNGGPRITVNPPQTRIAGELIP